MSTQLTTKNDGICSRCQSVVYTKGLCQPHYNKEYAAANKDRIRAMKKLYYQKNIENIRILAAERHKNNPSPARERATRRYREKRKECLAWTARWQKSNPAIANARSKKYRSKKLSAVPSWVDDDDITMVYEKANLLTRKTGIKHHVDHIVPLQSKIVCGLHVIENLQILTASNNCSKSNRLWPDMP